jgi:hypothetical protein
MWVISTHSTDSSSRPTSTVPASDTRSAQLSQDFRANFTGTSWYGIVQGIQVSGQRVVVRTDAFPDGDGKQAGQDVCRAILSLVNTNGNTYNVDTVQVYGQSDVILSSRIGRGDSCHTR